MIEIECRNCGACCLGLDPDLHHRVTLEKGDKERLPERALPWVLNINESLADQDIFSIGAEEGIRTKDGTARTGNGFVLMRVCSALVGIVGAKCVCTIYDQRPKRCRDFSNGSDLCVQRRHDAGLEQKAIAVNE
jgi:Fe-S-cluster containining protein